MRDIPMFTTEYGVASLALREIPYRQEAFITIQATEKPKELLEECIGFCRACGKLMERAFAAGGLQPVLRRIWNAAALDFWKS